MNTLDRLSAHHKELIGTIRDLVERAKADTADTSLLLTYCNEYLISHAEAEEVTFYTADDDADFANRLIREHKEIKQSLDAIDASFTGGASQELAREAKAFMTLLDRHFEEEENNLMPRLKAKMPEQELEALIAEAHQIEAEKNKGDLWSLFENDHRRIDMNLARVRGSEGNPEAMNELYSKARAQLLKHIELEEGELFPAFGAHASPEQMGPVRVMIAEHKEMTPLIPAPGELADPKKLLDNLGALTGKLAVHNKKEELILYPLVNRSIPRGERFEIFKKCYGELVKV